MFEKTYRYTNANNINIIYTYETNSNNIIDELLRIIFFYYIFDIINK